MRTPDIFISGLGVYLPETVSVASAVEQGLYSAEDAEEHGWTGVAVAADIPAPEMALQASQEALKRASQDPQALDLLLYADCWHQGPDGWQPQFYLQHHLVGGDLLAVEVKHGCGGVFSSLELAASYLAADAQREAALIVASDNFGTPLVDRWSLGPGIVAGDGAAAVVVTKRGGFARLLSICTTSFPLMEELHRAGEPLFPPGITASKGLDFTARINAFRRKQLAEGVAGPDVVIAYQKMTRDCLERTLSEAQVDIGDIAKVAITNSAREEAAEQFMGPLKLPLSQCTWEFGRTVGHMGAADHLVGIDHLLSSGQIGAGDHVLMLSIAPGITYSCAVIKILEMPPWAGAPST